MKKLTKRDFQEFLLLTLGTALVSAGVYFFKFPNHFSMGGVSGLAVLLGELFPHAWLSPSVFNTLINLLFLVLGFLLLDKGFGLKTVYCSLLYSGLVQVFEWIWPLSAPLTDELILELFFAVILPALGSGILFNLDASTGGTDIAAMILKKYTGLDAGPCCAPTSPSRRRPCWSLTSPPGSAPCWAWCSSRCWWTTSLNPSTAGRPLSSSPPTRRWPAAISPTT